MTSFELYRTLKTTAGTLALSAFAVTASPQPGAQPAAGIHALAAVATTWAASSQPDSSPAADDSPRVTSDRSRRQALDSAADRQRQIAERIEQEQSRNGPRSEGLIGPLSALALFYQENGDDRLAAPVIKRIRELVRANYGLHSLGQAPLIRQLIANEEAIGNDATAWDLEQELLTLARRHPDDLRVVGIFREIADKRLDILGRFLAGEAPPQIMIIGYCDDWPSWLRNDAGSSCLTVGRAAAVRAVVSDAQEIYAEAIAVILRNELYASRELRALEIELARSSDLIRDYNETTRSRTKVSDVGGLWRSRIAALARLANWDLPDPVGGQALGQDEPREREAVAQVARDYQIGRLSLERLFKYEVASGAPLLDQIDALLRIADWDLLYSERSALEGYELVYRMLEEMGAQASIDEIFAPTTPVVLPTFSPSPLASDETETSNGYIDAAFDITRYGSSRRVRIIDASTNATDTDKDRLVRLINGSRFRPRVTDGEFARRSSVVVRYRF
jgi:hypothetical protein